jgi:hypothetical protein
MTLYSNYLEEIDGASQYQSTKTLVARWSGKFNTLKRAERERKCSTRERLFEAGLITYLDAMKLVSVAVFVDSDFSSASSNPRLLLCRLYGLGCDFPR